MFSGLVAALASYGVKIAKMSLAPSLGAVSIIIIQMLFYIVKL